MMSFDSRRALLLCVVAALLQGCVGPRLGVIAVDGQPATPSRQQRVTLVRAGVELPLEPRMSFEVGDEIETGSGATVSIRWGSDTCILTPSTKVRIQNPSIFTFFGELFFSGAFKNETEYGVAAATGTKFAVKVGDKLNVRVLEGKVRVSAALGGAGTDLGVAQDVVFGRGLRVVSRRKMSRGEIDRQLQWIRHAEPGAEPIVPDVRGMKEAEAKGLLSRLEIGARVKLEPSTRENVGRVLSQSPLPDRRAKSVDLSVGAKSVATPKLVGRTRKDAQDEIKRVGLRVGKVRETITTGANVGKVTKQEPRAGDLALPNSAVDITIELPSALVPDLSGKTPAEATTLLRNRKLRLGTETEGQKQPNQGYGVIYAQEPKSGKRVRQNTAVNVTVTPGYVLY